MTTVVHPHHESDHAPEQHLSLLGWLVFSGLRQAFRGLYAAVACAIGALAVVLFPIALFSPMHADSPGLQAGVAAIGALVGIVSLLIDDAVHRHRVQGAALNDKGRKANNRT